MILLRWIMGQLMDLGRLVVSCFLNSLRGKSLWVRNSNFSASLAHKIFGEIIEYFYILFNFIIIKQHNCELPLTLNNTLVKYAYINPVRLDVRVVL